MRLKKRKRRKVLKRPGFAQRLATLVQVKPDVGGALRCGREVEHGAPFVRADNRINGLPLDETGGSAHRQLNIAALRELAEFASPEIDHIFDRAFRARLPRYAACTEPRGGDARERRRIRFAETPMKLVAHLALAAALKRILRHPIGDDVIVDFVARRDLYELHGTFAPIATGLDPYARTLVVKRAVVLVLAKPALALEKAEALRMRIEKCARLNGKRIVERPPNPLASPRPNAEPIAIVDLRPPIGCNLAIVL